MGVPTPIKRLSFHYAIRANFVPLANVDQENHRECYQIGANTVVDNGSFVYLAAVFPRYDPRKADASEPRKRPCRRNGNTFLRGGSLFKYPIAEDCDCVIFNVTGRDSSIIFIKTSPTTSGSINPTKSSLRRGTTHSWALEFIKREKGRFSKEAGDRLSSPWILSVRELPL